MLINDNGDEDMKKQILKVITFCLITVVLVGCGNSKSVENPKTTVDEVVESDVTNNIKETDVSDNGIVEKATITYPTMEEIEYYFEDSIRYEEPVAVFGYQNNSEFTIVRLDLEFTMKENITAEELKVFDSLKDQRELSDNDIMEFEPMVLDYMVCDPGEEVVGAICYMGYNLEPTTVEQCNFMNLSYAGIYFIAADGKIHMVKYSAKNDTHVLVDEFAEPYNWSDSEYANMLPEPDARIVEIDYDEVDYFQCSVYDMNFENFQGYMKECEEKGFSWDENNSISRWARNEEGYTLNVRYIDYMKMMEISLEIED